MLESEDCGIAVMRGVAANDNPGSGSGAGGGEEARIDSAVMTLARLIDRRIAYEELDRLDVANANAPARDRRSEIMILRCALYTCYSTD